MRTPTLPTCCVAASAAGRIALAVLLVGLGALACAPAGARDAIDARAATVDLEPTLQYLPLAEPSMDAQAAWQALAQGRFVALPRGRAQFGFGADTVWLATTLENPGDDPLRRTLVIGHPRLDRIDAYLRHGDAIRHVALGDSLPFRARAREIAQPNLELAIAPHGRVDVLVRVQSSSSLQVPMLLYSERALDRQHLRETAVNALYYGLLAGLLFYNLALFFAIRERTYLWYVLYVLAFGTLMLAFTGTGFEVLWPDHPWFANVCVPMFSALLLAATTAFQREFLDLRRNAPALDPWFRHGAWVMLALAAACLVLPPRFAAIAANLGTLVMSLLAFGTALLCAVRGFKPANYFLIAWTVLIAGGILVPMKNLGITTVPYAEYSLQVGSSLEMVLLAFALAYRINLLRSENERLLRESRSSLEHRVEARTRELEQALTELELANRHLRESSRRDGLTGVYNRRHLDDVLEGHVARASQHNLPLSLLMIDLDRFKAINDRRGHAAGDECLRAVAARIAAMLEDHADAFVARYGGEEFAVLLPMSDGLLATGLAERLRQTIARVPVATASGDVPVTISVGVATITARERDAESLLQRADQALYQAKHGGRNQVIAA